MLGLIASIFTSSASGGLFGGIFGLFKQSQERKERFEMARLELDRDKLDYENAKAERSHALTMLKEGATIELEKVEKETDAEIEISHQAALSNAQSVFKNLKTSTGMDNFRASVRPVLAYGVMTLFTLMLFWAFYSYSDKIDEATGMAILLGLFQTLEFLVTSIGVFYYVSRRNPKPHV